MSDELQLGGNINLSGFKEIDSGSMVVLKKIVGNYESCNRFRKWYVWINHSQNFSKIKH